MSAGDYLHWQFQYTRRVVDLNVLAATGDTTILTPLSASHTIYVQKISVNITTYAAKTWLFKDSTATPIPIAFLSIPAAAVALPSESGSIVFDFGPTGVALGLGTNLVLDVDSAGAAGMVHVEAYERQTSGTAIAMANTN